MTADTTRRLSNGRPTQELDNSGASGNNGDKEGGRASAGGAESPAKKSNKRRKVNHACVYCRRSHMTCDLERPCARCVKRDIGHLCHDEPREPNKRSKSEVEIAPAEKLESPGQDVMPGNEPFQAFEQDDGGLTIGPAKSSMGNMEAPQIIQPKPISPVHMQKRPEQQQYMASFEDWDFGAQNQFSDMHNLHPYNTFNTSEVTNEYNLLGDFLSTSLLDDGANFHSDDAQALINDPFTNGSLNPHMLNSGSHTFTQGPAQPQIPNQAQLGHDISRPSSAFPVDTKARDKFYMTAADPAGNDTPEERMNKLLQAKYDAGMLKPFNYVKGYARLNTYMERNMRPASRNKILRQLDKFRPKFREAMHNLTDIQLVKVEIWFERSLMEYDRVFASMAIPACCWRRTGEIFRGNKEMAELIHVPIEQLRDVGPLG